MRPQPIGGRYRVLEPLARHGAVATFAVEDLWLHRRVGLSVHDGERLSDRLRFERVAEVMASSWHPAVVPLYDLGAERQQRFVTFELPYETLASSLMRGPGDAEWVRALGLSLAASIGDLHEHRAVHGRLHPGAVGVDGAGRVQLAVAPIAPPPPGWGGETAWMAAEQLSAGEPTVEADVWALGALLLSSLVGSGPGPLGEEATAELAERLRRSNDPELIGLIARCLAVEPQRRPASMAAVAGGLGASLPAAPEVTPRHPEPCVAAPNGGRRRRAASPAVLGAVVACTTLAASLSVVVDHTAGAPPGSSSPLPRGCPARATVDQACDRSPPGPSGSGSTTAATAAGATDAAAATTATTAATPTTAATITTPTSATTPATATSTSAAVATTTAAPTSGTASSRPATIEAAVRTTSSVRRAGRLTRAELVRRFARRRAILRARARDRRLRARRLLARAERRGTGAAAVAGIRRHLAAAASLRATWWSGRRRGLVALATGRNRSLGLGGRRLVTLQRAGGRASETRILLPRPAARTASSSGPLDAGPPWAPRPGSLWGYAPAGGGYVPGRPGQPWQWSGATGEHERPAVA